MNNDLNDIFSNISPNNQNNNVQSNNNTSFNFVSNSNNTDSNINTNQLDNIFNIQSNNNNNNNNGGINIMNNQGSNIPNLIPQQPKFNIEQVYENTSQLKQGNKTNDPFNFVDDLLKK